MNAQWDVGSGRRFWSSIIFIVSFLEVLSAYLGWVDEGTVCSSDIPGGSQEVVCIDCSFLDEKTERLG